MTSRYMTNSPSSSSKGPGGSASPSPAFSIEYLKVTILPDIGSIGSARIESILLSQTLRSGSVQSPIHISNSALLLSKSGSSSVLFSSESMITVNLYLPSSVSLGTVYCHSMLSGSGGASA